MKGNNMFTKVWNMIVKLFTNKDNKESDSITGKLIVDLIIEQAIIEAESLLAPGSTQKQHVIAILEPTIKEHDLLDNTDLTLDKIIELLYNALKLSGKLDGVKKVVSDRDLSIAETIITDIRRGK